MAREFITRNFTYSNVTITDVKTQEVEEKVYSGEVTKKQVLSELIKNGDLRPVEVEIEVKEERRRMTKQFFIENSEVIED